MTKSLFDRVESTYSTHKDKIGNFDVLASLAEELGEFAKALRVEDQAVAYSHKSIKESSKVEICDLILVSIEAFIHRGGESFEEMVSIMERKIVKWEEAWKRENSK